MKPIQASTILGSMPTKLVTAGRPPRNEATLRHTPFLGGFDYLTADYAHQTFPRHAHEEYLVGVIESGVHDVWCQGDWWHASKDVVATFSPDEIHHGGAGHEDGWRQTIFYFSKELVSEVLGSSRVSEIRNYRFHAPFQHSPGVAACLIRLRSLLDSGADKLLVEQEIFRTLETVFEQLSDADDLPGQEVNEELSGIREHIEDNIHESFDIASLAELAGFSKRQFMSRFQKQFRIAPYQYVMLAKVRRARDLLRIGGNIAEAAYGAGFSDQSHLTRNFRAIFGVTPARYLQQSM